MSRAPSQPSLLPDATIQQFACFLGLELASEADREILRQMKTEVRQGYYRLCVDRRSLLPYLQSDHSIRPPYAATQISEDALRQHVDRIYALAAKTTKPFYDHAAPAVVADVGNWVVRWLLWHMLLHGDEEEPPSSSHVLPPVAPFDEFRGGSQRISPVVPDSAGPPFDIVGGSRREANATRYWDPARDN